MMRTNIVVVLCLLVASGLNAESSCKKGCPQTDNGLLKYTPGNVYEYQFDSIMTVALSAVGPADTDDTNLKVVGTANVFVEGNCGYTLQLSTVKVTATKESIEKKITQSIQKPVHFTMVNGKVQPEICTDASETAYALNVKRAIISLFHSNSEDETEVDVFGQCPTHTSISKIGGAEVVTKVRNLNSCAYREQIRSGIISGVVNSKAGVRSTMMLMADYSKESKLEHGIIDNVQLVEEYKFTGTPKGGAGVHAKVITNLKLKNTAGSTASAPATGGHVASIIFQKPETYSVKNIAALKAVLGQTVQLADNYVQKDAGKIFVELIRLMRNADADTLLDLATFPHQNKVLARKVYLDALFRTGTAESAKAILKQVNKMDDKEKMIAMLSLNLVQTVDKELMYLAATLVSPNTSNKVYLAIGHMVAKYCQRNGCSNGEVDAVSKKFTDALKHCKANNKQDEERIVYVLKGIRNAQHISGNVVPLIAECAAIGHSTRIRVAALQAFSASNCDAQLQQKSLAFLQDRNEDSELRIEAYLAAIVCPTGELANQIADIVNSETVYQVGGFIASNLRAIRDSTDATREQQRYHLANIRVTKKFPSDYRRYSYNNELSYKLDALGMSASSDYNLIYSQHGFLPRSARINVTTEFFGTNFNIFEASIRQENLESILEYYLGPKGLLNKNFDEIIGTIEGGGFAGTRQRRSIADDTGKLAKKYKSYGTKAVNDLNLDLSLKLFGSELLFLSLGDNIPSTLDDVIKEFTSIFENVKKGLSSYDKAFNLHTLFMDTDFMYPTGVGFPLELSAQGFAASKFEVGVEFDVEAILQQNWQQAKYRFKLVPSVDININVQVGFNAYVLTTGTRVVATLHSATGSDMRFEFINDGNGFNLDVELPRKKLELIDLQISSDFFIAEQDKDVKSIALKGIKKRKQEPAVDCFNQFEIVGFSICFASSIPDLSKAIVVHGDNKATLVEGFHPSRPFSFTLYLTSEQKFNLKGDYVPQLPSGSQQWKLQYSTPGSQVSHDTTLSFELGTKPRIYGRAAFEHPQYKFALEAGINNDQNELIIYGQYEFNDEIKRNKIGFVKNGNEYSPVIEVQGKDGISNDINGYSVDGKVIVQKTGEQQTRYNFEQLQVSRDQERVVLNGWADVGPVFLDSELHVAPGQESYLVKSNFKVVDGEYAVGMFVNDEKTPANIMGGSALVKVSNNAVNVDLVGKAFDWEVNSENHVQFEKPEGAQVITSSKFKHLFAVKKGSNVVGSFKLYGMTESEKKVEVDAEVIRGKKIAAVSVKFSGNQQAVGDYKVEVNGKLNKHFVDVLATCDIKGNVFVINNVLTSSWGTSLTAKGELGQRYTPQDIHVTLEGTAQFSGKDKPTAWVLKVLGAPEKTTSEFKLLRDNSEQIKLIGELQRPQDKVTAAKLNLQIKTILIAKADFKMAKNGKGELNANVDLLKTDPKHKIEVNTKFHLLAPIFNVETTVLFDTDKKIYFKTDNIVDKSKFSTKNIAEFVNYKFGFDASSATKGEWRLNGELQGNFAFTCNDGRIIDGTLMRKVATNAKTGVSQGNMEVQFNDQMPNGRKRSFASTGKLEKLNMKAKEFSVDMHCVYTNFDGQKVDVVYHMKNLPKGQNKMFDFGINASGDLVKSPVEVKVIVNEYSTKHAVYHVSGKYGEIGTGNINGNYYTGERAKPTSYEINAKVQVPHTTMKTFEFNSNGKFMKSETGEGGSYLAEMHIDEKTGNEQFVQFNTIWKGTAQQGTYNMALETQQMKGPLKMDGSYQRDHQGSIRVTNVNIKEKHAFNFNYAEKYVKTTADVTVVGHDSASVHYTLDTSFESAKDIDVVVRVQKLETESYVVNIQAKHSDKTYAIKTKFFESTHKKGIDFRATLPTGEPIVIVGIFEQLSERKVKLTMQVENLAELDLTAMIEAAYKNVDDFYIIGQCNSAKLNFNNYDLDIRSQGKAITFNLKNDQGDILTGSATYALKKEKNKAILEGKGQLEFNGKTHNSNFKLIRQHYDLAVDKEMGFSYTFNGNFGPKNAVSTLKISNKDFNIKLSVCEEKKQCTNVQVQSIVQVDAQEVGTMQHSLLILVDLRELGFKHEFELQSKTLRQGLKFQYNLNSNIISNNNMKYQLVTNVLPTSAKVQIILPSREILLETQQQIPPQGQFFGHYENSVAFYFDKINQPNDVTRLVASADISGIERIAINGKGQIKFEHPTIRPLTISGKIDANRHTHIADSQIVFDIFRVSDQKVFVSSRVENTEPGHGFNVTTSHTIHSSGLGFEYTITGHSALNVEHQEFSAGSDFHSSGSDVKASAFVFANKHHVELLVQAMNEQIIQLNGEFNRQKLVSKFSNKLQIFGQKPLELITELQPSLAKFSMKCEGIIDASAELKLGKEAKFNIAGSGKQLYKGRIALDAAKFLQTTYESNDADVKNYLETIETEIKKDTEIVREQIKKRFQKMREAIERQMQLVKNSTPDFSQLRANYANNANAIVKELENDPSLKQIVDNYRHLYGTIVRMAGDLSKTAYESYETLHKSFVDLHAKLETIFKNTVLPLWEELSLTTSKLIGDLRIDIINLYTKAFQVVLDVLEKYGPTFKNYGKIITESLKPLNEAIQEFYKVISVATDEFLDELKEYFSTLPTFEAVRDEFKDKLEKMKLVEKTLEFLNEAFDKLHILPLSTESFEFLQKAHDYLEAKLKHQTVDDEKLLGELFKLFFKAVRSIWSTLELESHAGVADLSANRFSSLLSSLPYSVDVFSKLPALFSFRFSFINYLLNENWQDIFNKETLKSWIFFHDFELKGHIADGRHIFTFDGEYMTFPGSCKYILAQDSNDNNFTVIAQLNNGKLKSLILTDRDGAFMEINDAGVLKMNGSPAEFPQHTYGMHAWRKFFTIWMRSEYGVQVMCTTDLKVCHINVDGFYTSKTRGLLGNGNAEPHDDYVQVDGTLASDYATFGNGYAMGKCAAIPYEEHVSHEHAEICSEIFGLESPLALGYLAMDSKPFRVACNHAVIAAAEKDKETAACTIATAYGSALRMEHFYVMLPPRCLKCVGAAGQRDLGQDFTMKIPNNKADLVFVVDTGASSVVLNQLLTPVVNEVRDALKTRGLTDVHIAVIAYNDQESYPALLTSDNGKINYQGKVGEFQSNGPKKFCENCSSQVSHEKKLLELYELVERLIKSVVPQSDELAFRMALNYPFRAGAAKSIIGVRSNTLDYGNVFQFIRAHITGAVTKYDGALLHMIAPVKDMSLEGVPTEKLVGFNSRLVATLDGKDMKKRSKLLFNNDMGIDFVIDNGGWVFATQNFEKLRPEEMKKAINQVTNSIADTLFKTEIVTECKCLPMHGLHAQHKCVIKSSNFVPNKKPKAA